MAKRVLRYDVFPAQWQWLFKAALSGRPAYFPDDFSSLPEQLLPNLACPVWQGGFLMRA
jgi:hypothetical protein